MSESLALTSQCPTLQLDDGTWDLNLWDANFVDIHLYVREARSIIVTAEWAANLPGLAAAHLGSNRLWWALLLYNGLYDSIRDVRVGMTLRIPDRDALLTYMSNRNAQNRGTNYLPNQSTMIV